MTGSIVDLLISSSNRFANKPAAIAPDRSLSFRELDELSLRFACNLLKFDVRPGDRVTLWMENGWRWMVAYYGILRLGAVVNPVNILLTPDEVAFIAEHCEARVIIAGGDKVGALRARVAVQMFVHTSSSVEGTTDFDSLLRDVSRHEPAPGTMHDQAAAICYTSGTTGRPKGAVLTHASIVLNTLTTSLMHERAPSDVIVSALPCPHVYGNIVMNSAVACGATLVVLPRFEEERVLEAIQQWRATIFEGVPTMYLKLLSHPKLDASNMSSLRLCTVGGQTMPLPKMSEVERRFGCRLIELWGMTELGGLGTTHLRHGPPKLGSIGIPLPTMQAKIVAQDDASTELPRGSIGELMVRGPLVMKGYHRDADATRDALEPDGWLHTGDLARQEEDGYLSVVDRKKEVILNGGYNVYPAEVERVIAELPSVAMVAVAPMNDELRGQVPKAFVVLHPAASCTEQTIVEHCRERLASYKVPRAVEFLPDLPKTSTGKVLRRVLAQATT